MKINKMFCDKKPLIAFEIFPPKPDVPVETIYEKLSRFEALKPDYISVTYGAGGSQKGRTIDIASMIREKHGIESMAHFTCVGHSREEIDQMVGTMHDKGLENILALRGDPPAGDVDFDFSKNRYCYAYELVEHIRSVNNFCIAAAAYVEGHVNSKRLKEDIIRLKQKVDSGVDFLITQLFFDNRLFYDFMDKVRSIGIGCPVAAGIMPIFRADQIKSITARSGCSIPASLVLMMDKYNDNPDDLRKAGVEYAAGQIRDLVENGVEGIHLYTMNRPESTKEILQAAGITG